MANSIIMDSSSTSKFIWKIENFSSLNDEETHFSKKNCVGDTWWSLVIYPKGEDGDFLVCLAPKCMGDKCYYAEYGLAIFNQKDHTKTAREDTKCMFDGTVYYGFHILPLSDLHDPDKGFIVEDTCIIQVEISAGLASKRKVASSDEEVASYPDAGKPFLDDEDVIFQYENFEYIGGFSILKRQGRLYKKIWLKYGHIATTKVIPASSYHTLVTLVTDIMNSIVDMYRCPLIEVSAEMIDAWESKISLAEKLEFNVGWLRCRFNNVKEDLNYWQIQKFTKEAGQGEANLQPSKVKVKNEPDEFEESLPGFVFEGML